MSNPKSMHELYKPPYSLQMSSDHGDEYPWEITSESGVICTLSALIKPDAEVVLSHLLLGSEKSLDDKATSLGIVSEGQKLTPAALEAWASRERSKISELAEVSIAMRDWINSVPDDTPLPAMPGFDSDWSNEIIDRINPKEAK